MSEVSRPVCFAEQLVLRLFTLKHQDPDSNCVGGEQDLEVSFAGVTGFLHYVQFNSVHE